jgi:hypothetical protein
MSSLYPDVLNCMSIQILEIKKMVYLYLINYARSKPDMVKYAMDGLLTVSYPSLHLFHRPDEFNFRTVTTVTPLSEL